MKGITLRRIERAQNGWEWDWANELLYRVCRENPTHDQDEIIVGKVWLIGRTYAAAIERGRAVVEGEPDFYLTHVAPKIRKARIDSWFRPLKPNHNGGHAGITWENLDAILNIHHRLASLMRDINVHRMQRSLASKYLHFHFPCHFFIYDSWAVWRLNQLLANIGKPVRYRCSLESDASYRLFAAKCLWLTDHIRKRFGTHLDPRQVDNLILDKVPAGARGSYVGCARV